MIIQGRYEVVFNKKVGPGYYKMSIRSPKIAQEARPGQFVHLRCSDSLQPFLRRPFSFHRINQVNFEILYKIIGQGTNILAKKRKGDIIDTLGPLGNGFEIGAEDAILVGGGMGVAPLLALAERLAHNRRKILVFIGAKDKKGILCEKDFRKLGLKTQLATEDGSRGHKGLITELLKTILPVNRLTGQQANRPTIYACGPRSMLKEVARLSRKPHLVAYGSLEENMACGVGACLGCAIGTKEGYSRVCKDGPVFNLREIQW